MPVWIAQPFVCSNNIGFTNYAVDSQNDNSRRRDKNLDIYVRD